MTSNPVRLNNWLINETRTQGYNPNESIKNYTPPTGGGATGGRNIIPLALAALAAKFLIFK